MLLIVVLIKIICHEFLNKLNKLSTLLSWVFGLFGEKSVIRIIFMLILCFLFENRYNLKKLTYEERKASLIERLNALNSAAGADDDDDEEDDE